VFLHSNFHKTIKYTEQASAQQTKNPNSTHFIFSAHFIRKFYFRFQTKDTNNCKRQLITTEVQKGADQKVQFVQVRMINTKKPRVTLMTKN
jgi:predicted SAM-dependent methyltransferase